MFQRCILLGLYHRLYTAYGPQSWWPARSDFEVIVGAVLTQNTAWTNVEYAIRNLRRERRLSLRAMDGLAHGELARLIRPAGYFNVKARRLKNVCKWLAASGGLSGARRRSTNELREDLLRVNGVGPETADSILLYAFRRPVFVIDIYTRRLLSRFGLIAGDEPYETLRIAIESALAPDHSLFNEYHALIVRHEKEKCGGTRDCRHCQVEQNIE
ncbi:MAG: endonuclease [Gammaproteobacteria bacterium]|nr:endonuclease [Gammaproteobacteria bacterium]